MSLECTLTVKKSPCIWHGDLPSKVFAGVSSIRIVSRSFLKMQEAIRIVRAATLDHPCLLLGDGVCEGGAVEQNLPGVACAAVNPDLNVVVRRRDWLRFAYKRQTAVVACEQFAGKKVLQMVARNQGVASKTCWSLLSGE